MVKLKFLHPSWREDKNLEIVIKFWIYQLPIKKIKNFIGVFDTIDYLNIIDQFDLMFRFNIKLNILQIMICNQHGRIRLKSLIFDWSISKSRLVGNTEIRKLHRNDWDLNLHSKANPRSEKVERLIRKEERSQTRCERKKKDKEGYNDVVDVAGICDYPAMCV